MEVRCCSGASCWRGDSFCRAVRRPGVTVDLCCSKVGPGAMRADLLSKSTDLLAVARFGRNRPATVDGRCPDGIAHAHNVTRWLCLPEMKRVGRTRPARRRYYLLLTLPISFSFCCCSSLDLAIETRWSASKHAWPLAACICQQTPHCPTQNPQQIRKPVASQAFISYNCRTHGC